jgi:hypothetical protein
VHIGRREAEPIDANLDFAGVALAIGRHGKAGVAAGHERHTGLTQHRFLVVGMGGGA